MALLKHLYVALQVAEVGKREHSSGVPRARGHHSGQYRLDRYSGLQIETHPGSNMDLDPSLCHFHAHVGWSAIRWTG